MPRDDGIGFEIRSLQELMAARALTEGEDAAVLGRLGLIAHSPHWRNTWLLAAGHLLRSERFERSIIQLLRRLDAEPRRLGTRYPTAPLLAADLLEDNLAVSRPSFERALMNRLFTVLDRPPVVGVGQAAQAFLALARTPHRTAVFERLGATASASMAGRAAASVILRQMATMTDDNGPLTSIRLTTDRIALSAVEDRAVTEWMSVDQNALYRRRPHSRANTKMANYLGNLVEATGLDASHLEVLRHGLHTAADASFETIKDEHVDVAIPLTAETGDPSTIIAALASDDISVAFELALDMCPSSFWTVEAMLGWAVKPALDRLPLGAAVLQLVQDAKAEALLDDL